MQNPIPVAVVGAGRFGRKHVEKYYRDAQATLVAIVDPNPALERFAQDYGARWFPSVAAVPAGLVRAATVAVPNAAHYATCAALMRAGVDVLVEKPFTQRLDEADTWSVSTRRSSRCNLAAVLDAVRRRGTPDTSLQHATIPLRFERRSITCSLAERTSALPRARRWSANSPAF